MNSSSIVMAFFLAGVVSVTIHNVVLGPIVLGPSNMVNQTTTNNKSYLLLKQAKNIELLSVKMVGIPL